MGTQGVEVALIGSEVKIGGLKGFAKPVNERRLQELHVFEVISKRVTRVPVAIRRQCGRSGLIGEWGVGCGGGSKCACSTYFSETRRFEGVEASGSIDVTQTQGRG